MVSTGLLHSRILVQPAHACLHIIATRSSRIAEQIYELLLYIPRDVVAGYLYDTIVLAALPLPRMLYSLPPSAGNMKLQHAPVNHVVFLKHRRSP